MKGQYGVLSCASATSSPFVMASDFLGAAAADGRWRWRSDSRTGRNAVELAKRQRRCTPPACLGAHSLCSCLMPTVPGRSWRQEGAASFHGCLRHSSRQETFLTRVAARGKAQSGSAVT